MATHASPFFLTSGDLMRHELAGCLVVRNEVDYIGRCIRSLAGLCDEIVLVDTGSTDGTMEAAAEAARAAGLSGIYEAISVGRAFHDSDGNFNFGAAKDFSLKYASTEYLLWMDGSEYVEDPLGLRHLFDVATSKFDNVVMETYTEIYSKKWHRHRIFPKAHGRFVGAVHEYVEFANPEKLRLVTTDAVIHHEAKPNRGNSLHRNIKILESDWKTNKSSRNAFYLGITHHELKNQDQAVKYLGLRIDNYGSEHDGMEALKAYDTLCHIHFVTGTSDSANALKRRASDCIAAYPEYRHGYYYTAKYHYLAGNREQYHRYMGTAASKAKRNTAFWDDREVDADATYAAYSV